ncbi:MAG: hypothetical protein HUU49_05105 [Candidatus Buchananbacteria bacterium]|nr:hypothetical protein [Candidatus Buchananbacteria bacterium]
MKPRIFGSMNGHAIAIIMKGAVRRAIEVIRQQRFIFEAEAKQGYSGEMDDLVTTADKLAQEVYVRMITECFPNFGAVGEENNLRIECSLPDTDIWFTVDPLDGTKAFGRRQSFGIGTMISLVCNGEVIAAYIGDVMTQEIFGFRPDSDQAHRISEFHIAETLTINPAHKLANQWLLLRELPSEHSQHVRDVIDRQVFKNVSMAEGSIGLSMARLWKGEVGGAVLKPGPNTPWDFCPILGISQKLGFEFLRSDHAGDTWAIDDPKPQKQTVFTEHEWLIIHRSRISELNG